MAKLSNLQKSAGKLSSIVNTKLPDIQGVVAASADGNIRLVNKVQLPNTIKDIICAILAGGLKNPFEGQLLCLEIALGNLIGTTGIPEELQDQLGTLKDTINGLLDHLGVNSTIARMQNIINQVASIYSMINFCDNPVTAPNIGDLLDKALGSLFGPAQSHINSMGNISDVSLCLNSDGSFNFSGLSSGLLKDISDDLPSIIATGVVSSLLMNNLKTWDTDVTTMMVTENAGDPAAATVAAAATTASNLYSAHNQLRDYPLTSGNNPWSAIANSAIIKNLEQQAEHHAVVASKIPIEDAFGNVTDAFFNLQESGNPHIYNDYTSSGATTPGTSEGIWTSDISELGGFESNVIAPSLGGTIGVTGGSTAGTNPGGGIVPGASGAGGSSTTGTILVSTTTTALDLFLQDVIETPQDGTGLLKKEANKAILELVVGETGKVTVVESGDGDPYKTLTIGLDSTFVDSIPVTWTNLSDTPSTITASKFVKSNAGGTALEFGDETDPVFLASPAGTITTAKITNWDEAHSWGNHALAGYLTVGVGLTHLNTGSGAQVYDTQSPPGVAQLRTLVAGDGVRIEQRFSDIFISGDEYLLKSRALTLDAVPVQVLWDTSQDGIYSETITPATDTCWFFTATFLARRTGGTVERNAFKLEGLVDNTLGTVGLVGPAAKTVYQNNATQWDVSVEILTNNLVFKVYGETGKEINWTIHLRYQPASETVNYGLDP